MSKKGKQSGGNPVVFREPQIIGTVSMTQAREWPNNQRENRDQAAENANDALVRLSGLMVRNSVSAEDATILWVTSLR